MQTNSNPHTINGLNPSSAYDFYVQGDCGGGDTSHWSNVFTTYTDCSTVDVLPYSESFDVYGASTGTPIYYPTCWSKINTYSSDRPYIHTTHYDGTGSLYFYAGTSGTYNIGITPEFGSSIDISSLKATFMYRATNASDRLIVGVISSITDASTFVPVDTLSPTQGSVTTWVEKSVSFANYTGNGKYIAFKNEYTTTNAYAYLDSLVIDLDSTVVADCNAPTALNVSGITANGATVTWTAGGSETAWNVQYKESTSSNWSTSTHVTSATHTFSGLTANTTYNVRVQADCGGGSTSPWATVNFTTENEGPAPCATPTGLTAGEVSGESISISWNADPNVSSWNIQYRQTDGGQLSSATSNTNSYTIHGLAEGTSYQIQVQANCGDGNLSDWSSAISVTTTGIANWLENSVTLFPNPAKEYVDIRIDGDLNVTMMEVYDVYGKLVNTVNVIDNPTRINVSSLANGMYFVRVTTEAGSVTKTFVKKG